MLILLSEKNQSLSKIEVYKSQKAWVNLALRNLKAVDREAFVRVLKVIAPGYECNDDTQIASIKYDERGDFQRCYPVSLMKDADNNLVIKLGTDIVPITLDNLDVEISEIEISKYADPALVISVETEDGDIDMLPLPLRFNDAGWNENKDNNKVFLKKLNIALKKANYAAIAEYLLEAKTGGGSTGNELVDIKTLPEMEPIKVTAVKTVTTKSGRASFILTLSTGDGLVDIWAPSSLKRTFELGGQLGEASELIYSTYQGRSGKTLISATISDIQIPVDETNDADLSDLF